MKDLKEDFLILRYLIDGYNEYFMKKLKKYPNEDPSLKLTRSYNQIYVVSLNILKKLYSHK